ncbi:MAG: hypothetical protein RMJ67_01160 [Elusimicrobiota bacterium]|nr:hypothetical protein [Endomicrobiia bacterium]MDW8165112.1 hypothetical protein [Elusimicrobiota bacterium]
MRYLKPIDIQQNIQNTGDILDYLSSDDISQVRTRFMPGQHTQIPSQQQRQSQTQIPRSSPVPITRQSRIVVYSGEPLRIILDAVKSSYGDAVVMDRKMVSLNEVIEVISENVRNEYLIPFSLLHQMQRVAKEMGFYPVFSGHTNRTVINIPYSSDVDEKYGAVSEEIMSEVDDKNISVLIISDDVSYINESFVREISRSILTDLGFTVSDEMPLGDMLNNITMEISSILERAEKVKRKRDKAIRAIRRASAGVVPPVVDNEKIKPVALRLLKKALEQYEQQLDNIIEENSSTEASKRNYKTYLSIMINRKIDRLPALIENNKYKVRITKYKGKISNSSGNEVYVYRVLNVNFNDDDLKRKYEETLNQVRNLSDVFGAGVLNLQLSDSVILVIACCKS